MLSPLTKAFVLASGCLIASAGFAQNGSDDTSEAAPDQVQRDTYRHPWSLEMGIGQGLISDNRYESTNTRHGALNYHAGQWLFQFGRADLGDSELQGSEGAAKVTSQGNFAMVSRRFPLPYPPLAVDVGIGAINAHSRAYLNSHQLESAHNARAFGDLRLSIELHRRLTLQAGARYYRDISGSDIHSPFGALRLRF